MRIIPVMDILKGQVVRGVGGRREEYRPVDSVLADNATPDAIGQALAGLGFTDVYLADLDAIGGAAPDWETYRTLIRCGLQLWVDAGVGSTAAADQLADFHHDGVGLSAIIAGLESLPEPRLLVELQDLLGPKRLIFSLDMKEGRPLTPCVRSQTMSPEDIALAALTAGVRRMIVLDLARVGMRRGSGSDDLCRRLRDADAGLEIISGGGVRGAEDLERLASAGCDAALVATALHDGSLRFNSQ